MESNIQNKLNVHGAADERQVLLRIVEHLRKRDFIPYEEITAKKETFAELEPEMEDIWLSQYYRYIDSYYDDAVCLKCGKVGLFKRHFLGKLTHSECGASSYMSTKDYATRQIVRVFANGFEAAADFIKPDKNGEQPGLIGKIFSWIFGFLVGFVFRLIGAVIVIPLQLIAYLTQGDKLERINVIDVSQEASKKEAKSERTITSSNPER